MQHSALILILIASVTVMITATVPLPPDLPSSSPDTQRSIYQRISGHDSSPSIPFVEGSVGQGPLTFEPSQKSKSSDGHHSHSSPTMSVSRVFDGGRYFRDVGAVQNSRLEAIGSQSSEEPKSEDHQVLNSSSEFQPFDDEAGILPSTSINRSASNRSEREDTTKHQPRMGRPGLSHVRGGIKRGKESGGDENGTLPCGDRGHNSCLSKLALHSGDVEDESDPKRSLRLRDANVTTDVVENQSGVKRIGHVLGFNSSMIIDGLVGFNDSVLRVSVKFEKGKINQSTGTARSTDKTVNNGYGYSSKINSDLSNKTNMGVNGSLEAGNRDLAKNTDGLKVLRKLIKDGSFNSTPTYRESAQENFEVENSTSTLISQKDAKEKDASSDLLLSSSNKTILKGKQRVSDVHQISMQQDGMHETATHENAEWDSTKIGTSYEKYPDNDSKNSDKDYFIKKASFTTGQPITTADAHMNDPPFRGPNVDRTLQTSKEKKDLKKSFSFVDPIVEKPKFHSLNLNPDWNQAKQIWGIAWQCQCYIIGSLFIILAIYSFISLLRVNSFSTLLKTGYYITINMIILVVSVLRALYLSYDPYNLSGKYPKVVSNILFKITLPSLTTAFTALMLSLLNSTQTQFLSPKFQKPSVLACIASFFLSFFTTCEMLVSFVGLPSVISLACQIVFIVWASLTSVCYFLTFKKLHIRALRQQGEMIRLTFTKMHIDGAQLPKKLPRPTINLAVKVVLAAAIFQLLLCCLLPYGTVFLQGLFPGIKQPDPWVWWGYQLLCRILELLICATISFTATQPQKHFEIEDDHFCGILLWFPCRSFANCCAKEELVDFEVHSNNYANPQRLRNVSFDIPGNSRRLQTNSLPTFRTPINDINNTLPMRNLPYSGRHTNHPSALSLLSYYRSKRTLSLSTNEGLEELEKSFCSQEISSMSDGRNHSLRPASMLYKDNGFIRFRRENDPEQPMEMSDEDERIAEEVYTSSEDADSTRANVGSSFQSLLECDIVQTALSPFLQFGYNRRFKKMSRISLETTDYSADVSSDQLSNVVNLRNGLSTSALDFHARKYGSTCSSESAANSFDVTFFLNSNSSPEVQMSPTSTTPVSLRVGSAYRSETEDDRTSSVEGHEVMLRSVSPIVKRASSGKLGLNLNLLSSIDGSHSNGHVNVACGTEDITPDSAVYLDLQLTGDASSSSEVPRRMFNDNITVPLPSCFSKSSSFKSPERVSSSASDTSAKISSSPTTTSQSLSDLRTSNSYVLLPRSKRNLRGFFYKLRGSTFSLNTAIYGYEPMHPEGRSERNFNRHDYDKKFGMSSGNRRPHSEAQLDDYLPMTPLGEFWNRGTTTSYGLLGDSGLLGDCQDYAVASVDVASQTEDTRLLDCNSEECTILSSGLFIDEPPHHSSMQV